MSLHIAALYIAADLPQGDPVRREILAALQHEAEAGWMKALKGLWPAYQEEHPNSKKPPKSLVEKAKEQAGEGGGEGDKGKKKVTQKPNTYGGERSTKDQRWRMKPEDMSPEVKEQVARDLGDVIEQEKSLQRPNMGEKNREISDQRISDAEKRLKAIGKTASLRWAALLSRSLHVAASLPVGNAERRRLLRLVREAGVHKFPKDNWVLLDLAVQDAHKGKPDRMYYGKDEGYTEVYDRTVKDIKRGRKASPDPAYEGNPSGKPIYDHEIDHGYDEPLAGGTDVMRRLQNQYRKEQGLSERPASPVIPKQAAAHRDLWHLSVAFGDDQQAEAAFADGKRQLKRLGLEVVDSEQADESTNTYYFNEPRDIKMLKRWVEGYTRKMGLQYWGIYPPTNSGRGIYEWQL